MNLDLQHSTNKEVLTRIKDSFKREALEYHTSSPELGIARLAFMSNYDKVVPKMYSQISQQAHEKALSDIENSNDSSLYSSYILLLTLSPITFIILSIVTANFYEGDSIIIDLIKVVIGTMIFSLLVPLFLQIRIRGKNLYRYLPNIVRRFYDKFTINMIDRNEYIERKVFHAKQLLPSAEDIHKINESSDVSELPEHLKTYSGYLPDFDVVRQNILDYIDSNIAKLEEAYMFHNPILKKKREAEEKFTKIKETLISKKNVLDDEYKARLVASANELKKSIKDLQQSSDKTRECIDRMREKRAEIEVQFDQQAAMEEVENLLSDVDEIIGYAREAEYHSDVLYEQKVAGFESSIDALSDLSKYMTNNRLISLPDNIRDIVLGDYKQTESTGKFITER